uniref:G-patch domain-containing protein n=1 Tax=Dunaliella tertiolecta TaxID=3047 RepID=A0A6S8P830_DUNTE|mmetsp:Transcript_31616/g.82205  ORF Transcript_31616/g.82205 Transcript_31616/m.82205 type:complete len:302 (+) Transcript_31616:51-956(+)
MSGDGDHDELEALLDHYSQQASREKEESEARHRRAAAKGRAPSAAARLASGLSKPLTQDINNKGLKMMQSMGYQPGKGLGAQSQGPTAPLAIDMRGKRSGLGVDEAKRAHEAQQQREAHERQVKRAKLEASSASTFQDATRTSFTTRRVLQHLHAAFSSLEQLLENAQQQHEREEQLEHEHNRGQMSSQLTALFPRLLTGGHIREEEVHHAMAQVPKAEEVFARMLQSSEAPEESPQAEAALAAEAISEAVKADPNALAAQLHLLLHFLRKQYSYCFWCGTMYDSLEQLLEACPGEYEDDH